MDAEQIHQPGPKLDRFLAEFANCFARKDTRAPLGVHVRGQLSDLAQKSVEPIALDAGVAPCTLREFLSQHKWDDDALRDRLQHIVRTKHACAPTVGILASRSCCNELDPEEIKFFVR